MSDNYKELFRNAEFINAINSAETKEKALEIAQSYGIEVSTWEEFVAMGTTIRQEMLNSNDGELNDEELKNVTGGDNCMACVFVGIGLGDTCVFVGIGFCCVDGI